MNEKMNKCKDEEEFIEKAKEYSKEVGIKINSNSEIVKGIVKGLFKNKQTKGEFYCPCRIPTGNKKRDEEIICPCVFHRGEIELEGKCRCFLFVK